MIIVEDRLREIIDQIPAIEINENVSQKPKFHWGDGKELNKFLTVNNKEQDVYPLVWLLPSADNHIERGNLCQKRVSIVIATRETEKDLLADERYGLAFKLVLNPLLDYVIQGLNNTSICRIEGESWTVERRPDYTENGENYTIDRWDAIILTADVEFNNHCLKTITWQTT